MIKEKPGKVNNKIDKLEKERYAAPFSPHLFY